MADKKLPLTRLDRAILCALDRKRRERIALADVLDYPPALGRRLERLIGAGLVGQDEARRYKLTDAGRAQLPGEDLRLTCRKCGRSVRVRSFDVKELGLELGPWDQLRYSNRMLACPFCTLERGGFYPLERPEPKKECEHV